MRTVIIFFFLTTLYIFLSNISIGTNISNHSNSITLTKCPDCNGTRKCSHCNGTGIGGYRDCHGLKQALGCTYCGGYAGCTCNDACSPGSGKCSRCNGTGVIQGPSDNNNVKDKMNKNNNNNERENDDEKLKKEREETLKRINGDSYDKFGTNDTTGSSNCFCESKDEQGITRYYNIGDTICVKGTRYQCNFLRYDANRYATGCYWSLFGFCNK